MYATHDDDGKQSVMTSSGSDLNPRTLEPLMPSGSSIPSVVHVYKGFPPVLGGIEGHIDLLTRLLMIRGVRSEVLCAATADAPAMEDRAGVRVRRLPVWATLASTPLTPSLPWALRRTRASIVHLHYPWPPAEAAWLLAGRGRPLVITVHCEVIRYPALARWLAPITQRTFAAAERIIVTDPFLLELVPVRDHRDRAVVIPLGVDTDWFRPDPGTADPLPHVPRPRLLFVGRLRHYKGLPVLAQALALLPDVQLVVVGDGPERGSFERILKHGGVADRAHLLGTVDDQRLRRVYQTADVCVLPSTSRAEAFGVSMAEAQACGLPGVTTVLGTGTTQVVRDGVSGRVVVPDTASALADAIRWCLAPERHADLRRNARVHVEQNLNAQQMVERTAAIYAALSR
jgi:rhamnosyl/mannosyltransferase